MTAGASSKEEISWGLFFDYKIEIRLLKILRDPSDDRFVVLKELNFSSSSLFN